MSSELLPHCITALPGRGLKGVFPLEMSLCEQHVTRERRLQRACITTRRDIITMMCRKQLHTPTLKTKKLGGKKILSYIFNIYCMLKYEGC